MDHFNFLIRKFEQIYKVEVYLKLIKLIPTIFLVIICPFALFKEIAIYQYFNGIILIIAEFLLIFYLVNQIKNLKNRNYFKNSNILKCFYDKSILNKIIVTDNKLFFDINGIEDETINLKNEKELKIIINSLTFVFSESKIVYSK